SCLLSFFVTAPPPSAIYTLSLHDALPIYLCGHGAQQRRPEPGDLGAACHGRRSSLQGFPASAGFQLCTVRADAGSERHSRGKARSEEHTSELQSRENLVCRLLLEKKKKRN